MKYHVHNLVEIYVHGHMVRRSAGIGINRPQLVEKYSTGKFYDVGPFDCLYSLHTHAADGIIHVEAPAKRPIHPRSVLRHLESALGDLSARSGKRWRGGVRGRKRSTGIPATHDLSRVA